MCSRRSIRQSSTSLGGCRLAIGALGFCTTNGGVRHAQEAGPAPGRVDRDAVRQVEVRQLLAQLERAVRAEAGMRHRRVGGVAGVHHVGAAIVVAFLRVERADDRQVVHLLGHLGQMLA